MTIYQSHSLTLFGDWQCRFTPLHCCSTKTRYDYFQATTDGPSVPHLMCRRTEATFTTARPCYGVFVIHALATKLQTYLLTYLLTYYKRQLRKENEEKRILQVGDMLASPPNVRSLGVRGLGLHVPLTVLPLFDLQLRAASQSARCFHISKSGNCQEVGRHPVRATSARDIAWLLSHRVRANAGQYMHRHSGSRDTNILPPVDVSR